MKYNKFNFTEAKIDVFIENKIPDMKCLTTDEACILNNSDLCKTLKTDIENGLDINDVKNRLLIFGFNEFKVKKDDFLLNKYIEQFKNPLILLLLASAFVSILMKQFDDAISITVAITIVVTVAFIQEYRSEKSLQELNKLVPPKCTVIRNGKKEELLAKNLVPGDLVCLFTGSRIPADLRLVETADLTIDESSFTGETEPSLKISEPIHAGNSYSVQNVKNIAFMGTLVSCGNGKGIVITTAKDSQFGTVFKMMESEEPPKTPLQKSMDSLGKQLSIYSLTIIFFIMVTGWIQGRPILEMFNIGVSLAVAAIPEGLPIVVTVTLALGVLRMANKKCIVKKLPTVETLGCVNVICTDKTGTLTKNEMTVINCVTSELQYGEFSGIGYHSVGDLYFPETKENFLNEFNTTINLNSFIKLFQVSILCNKTEVNNGKLIGQPTEGALVIAAEKLNINVKSYRNQFIKLEEQPFNSEKKTMMVKIRSKQNLDENFYCMKGALENILKLCKTFNQNGDKIEFSEERARTYLLKGQLMGKEGLRVLGVCYGTDLKEMVFLGMIGILDPPRHKVDDAVQILIQSGVQIKMITGDAEETAVAIAKKIGMYSYGNLSMSGEELEKLSDKDLSVKLPLVSVFYRTTPIHKLKIVKILQNNGYIVGMTGDGVNDGIALKKADIGISMGKSGTDVCKEAADMILVDDNFCSIMTAIEEGKAIFYNIRNFVKFQLSTSIAALSLIAISTLAKIPSPLNPMQILWINIIMDGPPAQSLAVEPVDHDVLKQAPRNVKQPMINLEFVLNVLLSTFIIIFGTLFVFIKEMSDNVITPRDITMTFTCFVLFDMFNALSCRTQTKSIFNIGLFSNKAFNYSVLGSLIGQLLVIYFPPLQKIFDTEAISFFDLLTLILISSSVFFITEIKKYYARMYYKKENRSNIYINNCV